MKIVMTDIKTVTPGDLNLDVFNTFGEVTKYELTQYNDLYERIRDAEAILCNKTKLDESALRNAPNLKYIGLFATGYNNVDVNFC